MRKRILLQTVFAGMLFAMLSVNSFAQESFFDGKSGFRVRVLDEAAGTVSIVPAKPIDSPSSYTNIVTIPETITNGGKTYTIVSIDDSTFMDIQIQEVRFSNKLKWIGEANFSWMKNLRTPLVIPDGVEYIGKDSFYRNLELPSVKIGKGLTYIADGVFTHNPKVTFEISPDNPYFKYENNILFKKDCDTLFVYTGEEEQPVVPATFKHIGARAFEAKAIKDIQLPEGLESIGNLAFLGCELLTEITLPASVNNIGSNCFFGCFELKNITVAKGNKSYLDDKGALFNIDRTKLIRISSSNDLSLASGKYTVPASVVEIADGAFAQTGFSEFALPQGLKKVGGYAFHGCVLLRELIFPEQTENIGMLAAAFCNKLEKVKMGPATTFIGRSCFYNSPIREMRVNCATPPEVELSFIPTFDPTTEARGTLFVPVGTKDLYRNADGFVGFRYIEEKDFTAVADVAAANLAISVSGDQLTLTVDEPQPIAIYDLTGRSIATSEATTSFSYTLPKGTYIVRCGDKVTRVVM